MINNITTQEFSRLTKETFNAKLKPANFASKNDIADFPKIKHFDEKLININKKVTLNKVTKYKQKSINKTNTSKRVNKKCKEF